jgi:membrane protease subunit (stomatin/prohibitin family)
MRPDDVACSMQEGKAAGGGADAIRQGLQQQQRKQQQQQQQREQHSSSDCDTAAAETVKEESTCTAAHDADCLKVLRSVGQVMLLMCKELCKSQTV